nr:hypothetical protein [Thermosipho japonicus]
MLKGYSVNQNLSIQLSDKELESLIEYLKNEKYEIHEEINSDKKRFDIKSKFFKDYLVLTYHLWSRKLQIQGKARDVLNNIELFLAEFGKTQDLLQKVYDVSRSEYNDFEQTVDKIVHGAYTHEKVSETLKGLMITAYFNYLESPNMPYRDFSFYLIPAARVLEAFIKWGLYMFKIADKLPEKEAIGNYFERIEKSNSFTIKKEFRENCNCEDDLIVIEKCYNYYHKYRHIYSHASPIEGHTSTISSKQEVNDLIMTALKLTGELFNRFPL